MKRIVGRALARRFLVLSAASVAACQDPLVTTKAAGVANDALQSSTDLSAAATYTTSLIPLLPDSMLVFGSTARSSAWGISSKHYIVGASERSYLDPIVSGVCTGYGAFVVLGGEPKAFFHQPGDALYSCTAQAIATAINDRLQVVGMVQRASVDKLVFYWDSSMPLSSPRIFRSPAWGGIDDIARAINDKGVIVGHVESAEATHATRWDTFGRAVDIHPVKYHDSKALVINNTGLIAGTADGFVGAWLPDGSFISSDLRVGLSVERWMGVDRYPIAINDHNLVTFGSTPAAGGPDEAYEWAPLSGALRRLSSPPNDMAGFSSLGRSVGYTRTTVFAAPRGYTRFGATTELLPGVGSWKELWPNALNKCGTIVGALRRGSGLTAPTQAVVWRKPTCD